MEVVYQLTDANVDLLINVAFNSWLFPNVWWTLGKHLLRQGSPTLGLYLVPVPVHGLLGTKPRKQQASQQSFICTWVRSRLCAKTPPQSMEDNFSSKTGPWYQKDCGLLAQGMTLPVLPAALVQSSLQVNEINVCSNSHIFNRFC